jgi:hypothetical protein
MLSYSLRELETRLFFLAHPVCNIGMSVLLFEKKLRHTEDILVGFRIFVYLSVWFCVQIPST